MADVRETTPLPLAVHRGLSDKLVEKRKGAALELERTIKDLVVTNDYAQVKQIISVLEHDFTLSSSSNARKGGLVALAATAIGLGKGSIGMNLPELVQPVLTCFEDQDSRVRYYACESLYNISKVARGAVLVFFNNIFEGLCKLSCDSDSTVRYGAELLDRLMKDIVSENPHFDIDNFIILLRDRIYTNDAFARQLLVSWITFLDSVPDIHLQEHIPEFIDGLFCILGDQRREIRRMAEEALGELLKEVESHPTTVRFEAMANIIAVHCQAEDKVIQFTALNWMKVFLELSQHSLLVFASNILVSILPCVAYELEKSHIREVALVVNDRLKQLIRTEDDEDTETDEQDKDSPTHPALGIIRPGLSSQTGSNEPAKPTIMLTTPPSTESSTSTTASSTSSTGQTGKTGQTDSKPNPGTCDEGSAAAKITIHYLTNQPIRDRDMPRIHLLAVIGVLLRHMKYTQMETRMETLRWLLWLHQKLPKRIYRQAGKLFPALLDILTDLSDKVVRMSLNVIAVLSTSKAGVEDHPEATPTLVAVGNAPNHAVPAKDSTNHYFRRFLIELLRMFDKDRSVLDRKGQFIIRNLCVNMDAHLVYCTLAEILYAEESLAFASLMVQVLNMILFTAAELFPLRQKLTNLDTIECWSLFTTLYCSWCHNPVATLAVCLLSQNYEHASTLVQKFSEIEITAGILKEIDKLVQLIESPIFVFLRLQLLDPQEYPSLVRTLYGLLMLLPQSEAFEKLKQRLSCVPVITGTQPERKKRRPHRSVPKTVSFEALLDHFVHMQQKHSARRKSTQPFRLTNH